MTQFLSKLPFSTKENEDILNIVYSMMNFAKDEVEKIKQAREKLNQIKGNTPKTKGNTPKTAGESNWFSLRPKPTQKK